LVVYEWAAGFCDGKKVLDAGCGVGYGTGAIARKASQVTGIDRSAEAISFAQTHYEVPNAVFMTADLYELPFEDNSFDLVCSFQVIEHLKYPEKHLREVARILSEGGTHLISTPNRTQFGGEFHLIIPFHYREFTPPELRQMLERYFAEVQLFGLRGNDRIDPLHEMDRQAVLKLVKLDPLKIRRIIPRKIYELAYPFLWKRSRENVYHKYNDLVESVTTADFILEALARDDNGFSCWDIYAIASAPLSD
jgi:ubiquinone/menaquinone biosynthesis C-methylase UbiE